MSWTNKPIQLNLNLYYADVDRIGKRGNNIAGGLQEQTHRYKWTYSTS